MDYLKHNGTGWGLIILGLITMAYAHHVSFDRLEGVGAGFIPAALLALQVKLGQPTSPKE